VPGAGDMDDVLQTAQYLRGEHPDALRHDGGVPWRVRRTSETGLSAHWAEEPSTSYCPTMRVASV
jgi:hypothetical protein